MFLEVNLRQTMKVAFRCRHGNVHNAITRHHMMYFMYSIMSEYYRSAVVHCIKKSNSSMLTNTPSHIFLVYKPV